MENYDSALEQLRAHGLVVDEIDTTDRFVHVPCDDAPRKKHGWYRAHLFVTKDGKEFIVGSYGDWRRDDKGIQFKFDLPRLTADEKAELKAQRENLRRAAEAERQLIADQAGIRSRRIFEKLPDSGTSDYLKRKGVRAYGVRFAKGTLVVPLHNDRGELVGLQWIDGAGNKKFITGTPKLGAWHRIGADTSQGPVAITEGYATGATVHEAMGWPVAVVFDAGNIMPVATALRRAFPGRLLVLCADDDHELAKRRPDIGNAGVKKAEAAAAKISGLVAVPSFQDSTGRTDWNDLQAEQGVEAVRSQLKAVIQAHEASRTAVASVTFTLDLLLNEFVVIHGTTFVWDNRRGRLMPLGSLRVSAGEALVKAWLAHPLRRMVDEEAVVFDPGEIDPRVPKINLFTGMEVTPDPSGSCDLLLKHLFNLCGERERLYDWVLKWIALPLQRRGTKMQTAIVMYGAEGTGKNLFWGAVPEIYGRWGVLIGQAELESTFNGWESAKLFMVADEVVPRNEMRHMKGRLKQLITSDRVMVNEKNQPVREERNCMNGVFLSNENQPLLLDKGDRRYCGIRCDVVEPIDYYRRVGRERDNGGVEALYHYLLNYDLEDFDEHTKPFETDERSELIAAGEAPSLRFWEDWREGQLPLPYCSCRAQDLYMAFRAWCAQTGERFVPNETQFGLALRPLENNWFLKQRARYLTEEKETRPTCYVLLEASGADQVTRDTIIQTTATNFRDAALSYLNEQRKAKL